jgi:hypothetical protein
MRKLFASKLTLRDKVYWRETGCVKIGSVVGGLFSFPRSAWERTIGRSAARLSTAWVPAATRSVASVRSHAERGNEKNWLFLELQLFLDALD